MICILVTCAHCGGPKPMVFFVRCMGIVTFILVHPLLWTRNYGSLCVLHTKGSVPQTQSSQLAWWLAKNRYFPPSVPYFTEITGPELASQRDRQPASPAGSWPAQGRAPVPGAAAAAAAVAARRRPGPRPRPGRRPGLGVGLGLGLGLVLPGLKKEYVPRASATHENRVPGKE